MIGKNRGIIFTLTFSLNQKDRATEN